MRTSPFAIALALLLSGFLRAQSTYGLPVRLGATPAEVEKVLGKPSETVLPDNDEHLGHGGHVMSNMSVDRWYDTAGIVGTFTAGKLSEIKLFPDTDFPNFVPYAGNIAKGLTLRDNRKSTLEKLGKPTKVDDEPLGDGVSPDKPVINPQQTRYFWTMDGYTLQATFLSQPKLIREAGPLVIPRDTLLGVVISK